MCTALAMPVRRHRKCPGSCRHFLEDLEDLRCAARIDSLTHMMSNFIYMEVHDIFGQSSMQLFDRLMCPVGLGGYRVMSKNLTPGMQDMQW